MIVFQQSPIVKEGNNYEVSTQDDNVWELLENILKELQINNFHNCLITDNWIGERDIDLMNE